MPISWETIRKFYGVDRLTGCSDTEIEALKAKFGTLPQSVEEFYRTAAATEAFQHGQDQWVLPNDYETKRYLKDSENLILLVENQGVCSAGVLQKDLCLSDPPVYVTLDDENWMICAPSVREFLLAALAYEAVFDLPFAPEEMYWITDKEHTLIKSKLTKLPASLTNWLNFDILLYQNEPDNMVAVLDCDDELQMLYGAASEASYRSLLDVLDGMGEPI